MEQVTLPVLGEASSHWVTTERMGPNSIHLRSHYYLILFHFPSVDRSYSDC